jgi:uncharacterized OsmC-like protein
VRRSYQGFTGVQPTTNHDPVCFAPTDPARSRTNTKEEAVATTADVIRNGVDTERLFGTLDAIKAEPSIATFQFRARNRWIDGAHNRTTIRDFYAANQEDTSRVEGFVLDAGEPAILLGTDTGPNPAEYLLHALAACLTTSLVYVAAARGVHLTEVESTVEGDMDVRGALGLSDEYRNGFERIRVSFRVEGDAPEEKLRELVARAQQRSAVFDMVTNGAPVTVDVATA